jgi:tetratricopeptide (TPR) repeat protein
VNNIMPQVITQTDLALVYSGLGEIDRGLELAQASLALIERKVPYLMAYPLAGLLQLHLRKGNLAEAEATLARLRTRTSKSMPIHESTVYFAEAELALAQRDYGQVLALTEPNLALLQQAKMLSYVPRVLDIQAQALLALGQREAAAACWQEARERLEAMGGRTRLWPILLALSQLAASPTEAADLRQQTAEIVRAIAVHISSPDLQASFLNLPSVKAALSGDVAYLGYSG